jgi:exodeoxyribonuclease VII large subunit
MALDTSPDSPAPVRTIARSLADWINRLGSVWVDGQVAEYRPRPGARFHYFVLRDTDVDMSLTVKADSVVIGRLDPPLQEGQRLLVHAKPDFYAADRCHCSLARFDQ